MSRSKLALFAPALAVASVLFASNAFAIECKADADCGDGFKCEKPISSGTVNCPPGSDCPEPAPAPDPATIPGVCIELPKTCTVDADCGQPYLKCDATPPPPVACADAPDVPGGAPPERPDCVQPEPDPNAPRYCTFSPIACAADAECPTDWACTAKITSGGTDCAAPTCPAGQECPAPTDCTPTPGETKSYCEPKKVDCADNAACPSGWTCEVVGGSGCASSGSAGAGTSSGSSGGTPTPVPPAPGDECMPTETKQCIPPGIRSSYGGGAFGAPQASGDANGAGSPTAGGGDPKGPGLPESGGSGAGGSTGSSGSSPAAGSSSTSAPAASGDGASSDDGGCSVAHGAASTWPLALALSGLLARIARRRK